jgi:hypothetical protein
VKRLLCLLVISGSLLARAESFDAPFLELGPTLGGRAWSGTDDSVLLGGHLSLGVRVDTVRFGVVGQALSTRTFDGLGLDLGAFVSWDFLSAAIDSRLSAGAFLRVDGSARYVPSQHQWGAVPMLSVGAHAGGLWLAFGAGPEIGLHLPGGPGWGFTGQVTLGVELFEAFWLCDRLGQQNTPLPP